MKDKTDKKIKKKKIDITWLLYGETEHRDIVEVELPTSLIEEIVRNYLENVFFKLRKQNENR